MTHTFTYTEIGIPTGTPLHRVLSDYMVADVLTPVYRVSPRTDEKARIESVDFTFWNTNDRMLLDVDGFGRVMVRVLEATEEHRERIRDEIRNCMERLKTLGIRRRQIRDNQKICERDGALKEPTTKEQQRLMRIDQKELKQLEQAFHATRCRQQDLHLLLIDMVDFEGVE